MCRDTFICTYINIACTASFGIRSPSISEKTTCIVPARCITRLQHSFRKSPPPTQNRQCPFSRLDVVRISAHETNQNLLNFLAPKPCLSLKLLARYDIVYIKAALLPSIPSFLPSISQTASTHFPSPSPPSNPPPPPSSRMRINPKIPLLHPPLLNPLQHPPHPPRRLRSSSSSPPRLSAAQWTCDEPSPRGCFADLLHDLQSPRFRVLFRCREWRSAS